MSDLFVQVTRRGTRFQLPQGELSVEQLWQLKPIRRAGELVDTLADYEAQLQEEVAKFGTFTRRTSVARTVAQEETMLKLAVVSYILDVKDKEAQEAKDSAARRAFNAEIDARIARKQDAQLDDLSIEELQKLKK
jgi:hypothetical protein